MTPVTMYSTTWCGYCRRLKRQFEDAGIAYREIDVDREEHYGDRIVEKTGGFRVVPTIEIEGGDLLVNPSIKEVQKALEQVG
jgi:glutaredoxin-like protein